MNTDLQSELGLILSLANCQLLTAKCCIYAGCNTVTDGRTHEGPLTRYAGFEVNLDKQNPALVSGRVFVFCYGQLLNS